jgi:predicted ATPase
MASDAFLSITIEGFKSIRSIKDLPLRPINLLIGANGSGKSNFLEAFVFLREAKEGRKDAYVALNGGGDKLLHFGSKTTQKIWISLELPSTNAYSYYFMAMQDDSLVGIETFGGLTPPGGTSSALELTWQRYQFHDTGRFSPIKKTNQIDDNRFLRPDGGNLAAFLYRLQQKHKDSYRAICRTVQQVAPFFDDFQLEPLALNPETIKLEWRHKNSDQYFDASALSDGTLRFIALATLFLQPVELRPALILVDEPELGMHPYAIEILASLIRQASKETQVIAATQSSLLLDQFDPEDILVANRVDGATTVDRLKPESLAEWLKDYSLGQLWEKGEFAGRPVKE